MNHKTPSAGTVRTAQEIMHYAVKEMLTRRYRENELTQYLEHETNEPLAHLYKNMQDTDWTIDALAEYIDRETGAAEMAEVLEKLMPQFAVLRLSMAGIALDTLEQEARNALAKYKGESK